MAKTAAQTQPQTTTEHAPTHEEIGKPIIDALLKKEFTFTPFLQKDSLTLTPQSVMRFLCKPTKSGQVCTVEQATRFCMLCKARGLNPWEGDAFLTGYDTQQGPEFSLITAYVAFLKRAEVHPEYDGMDCGITIRRSLVDADGNKTVDLIDVSGEVPPLATDQLAGAWARVDRKNRKTPTYRRINLGPYNKQRSRWNDDPHGMIVKCAAAKALRETFPNSLGGMYIAGEMEDEATAAVPTATDAVKSRLQPVALQAATNGHSAVETLRKQYSESQEQSDDAGPIPPLSGSGVLPGLEGAGAAERQ